MCRTVIKVHICLAAGTCHRSVCIDSDILHCGGKDGFVYWRQCGPVVRVLALRSGDPGFKTSSDYSLNLFPMVPSSTFYSLRHL